MTTPIPIQLSIDYSSHPGNDWRAWLGFKPLTRGFSLLAWYSGAPSKRAMRLSRRSAPLCWRSACHTLLSLDEIYLLGGDYRGHVQVEGIGGWQSDILAMCWLGGDFYRYHEPLDYLLRQTDDELVQLLMSLPDGFDSDDALILLNDLTDTFGCDDSVSSLCGGLSSISAGKIRSLIESEDLQWEQKCAANEAEKTRKLSPFKAEMDGLIQREFESKEQGHSFASGFGHKLRIGKLSVSLQSFVLENDRLPTDLEWETIRAGKYGSACTSDISRSSDC